MFECRPVFGSILFVLCPSEAFGRAWCYLICDKNAELRSKDMLNNIAW